MEKPTKKNLLEAFFPICHFFDASKTNWTGLVPARNFSKSPPEKELKLPFTFGISYANITPNYQGVKVELLAYFIEYYELEIQSRTPGEVFRRGFIQFSANYLYPLVTHKHLLIWAKPGVDFRYGNEAYHISYPRWFEQSVDGHDLADLGPSIGLKLSKPLPWNFQIGTEAKYTRFLYRRDKGNPYYPFDKGASPNLLTVQLNVGYRF